MKKIYVLITILLLCGCAKENSQTNNKNDDITGYYKLVSAFKYIESEVISYDIGEKTGDSILEITPQKLTFFRPILNNKPAKETHEYKKVDNEIRVDGVNYNGTSVYIYDIKKSPIKDNIILSEIQTYEEQQYEIIKEFEKITKEEFEEKMVEVYEE